MFSTCAMAKQWRLILADGRNALILTVVSLKMLYCLQVFCSSVCYANRMREISVLFLSA